MLLLDGESNVIWNRVYDVLHFQPSIEHYIKPFEIAAPYVVYDISSMNELNIDIMDDIISKIFIACTTEDEYMYALDWQHSDFRFQPRDKSQQQSLYIKDERYMGGGYTAYFPSYYPDGDYYFFIASDFRFGYLGHPWQQKVWIFGEELIKAFEIVAPMIGFLPIESAV